MDGCPTLGYPPAHAAELARYPRFAERGATHAHDPLAIATIVEPELVATRRLRVEVEAERAAERIVARIAGDG